MSRVREAYARIREVDRPEVWISLRPVWGSQDSAFAAALPVGLFLPAHLKIPEPVRQAL